MVIISSVNQYADLARKYPALLNIGSFSLLRSVIQTPTSGCNKCGRTGSDIANYRPQFEAAFALLSEAEQTAMKDILSVHQICYYSKTASGQLKKNCF